MSDIERLSQSPTQIMDETGPDRAGSLEPLTPRKAVEMYLDERQTELRQNTIDAHYYRLKQFCDWCDRVGIDNLNDLSGRDLHRYKVYRSIEQELSVATVRGDLFTLQMYLEFCEVIDAVTPGLHDRIEPLIPSLSGGEGVSDATIESERVEPILEHLRKFEYAACRHVIFEVAWHVGCRLGALRTLDVGDYYPDPTPEQFSDLAPEEVPAGPCLDFRHRPESETPLKNGRQGERPVNISQEIVELLDDYLRVNRHDVVDDYGREPLFTSAQGRVSGSSIREWFYQITRPCLIEECPHDRELDSCEAMEAGKASLCPSSRAPHAVRTGAITHMRSLGIAPEAVSDRVNASQEVIEKHYDQNTARTRTNLRRDDLEEIL